MGARCGDFGCFRAERGHYCGSKTGRLRRLRVGGFVAELCGAGTEGVEVPMKVGGEPLQEAKAGGSGCAVAPGGGDFGEMTAGEEGFHGDFEREREAGLAFE